MGEIFEGDVFDTFEWILILCDDIQKVLKLKRFPQNGYAILLLLQWLGLGTIKRYRYWYRYHFKKYCIVPFHSLQALLNILTTVKFSSIRDCPGS